LVDGRLPFVEDGRRLPIKMAVCRTPAARSASLRYL